MKNFFNTHILPMVNMAVNSNKNSVAIKIATPNNDAMVVAIGLFYLEDSEQVAIMFLSSSPNALINNAIEDNLPSISEKFYAQHIYSRGKLQPIYAKTYDDAQKMLSKEITETLKDKDIKYIKNVKQKRN